MKYLNLGCGDRFHPSWTNINFTSTGAGVIAHDLKQGIPYPDNFFDVVYHSHVLEHLNKKEAEIFIRECDRVLRPQGILRVVVPDLEQIAKMYLYSLEKASNGSEEWEQNYEWMLLEMYDQTVRNFSGGEMANYLFQENIPNLEFVNYRCGVEATKLIKIGKLLREQKKLKLEKQLHKAFKKIYHFLSNTRQWQELLIKIILGKKYSTLKLGEFRQSGEVHQWMYDRYSLKVLLQKCGFRDITQQSAITSYITGWSDFNLDTEPDGSIYKPDSIFMEAIKPLE